MTHEIAQFTWSNNGDLNRTVDFGEILPPLLISEQLGFAPLNTSNA